MPTWEDFFMAAILGCSANPYVNYGAGKTVARAKAIADEAMQVISGRLKKNWESMPIGAAPATEEQRG